MQKTKMLKKNYEFRNVLTKGKYYSGKYIEAFILENKEKENFLGLAISHKVANAVNRNHIKRLIRENYKNIENNIKNGYSIVFLWRKKANVEDAIFENVKNDVLFIIDKSGIKKKEN